MLMLWTLNDKNWLSWFRASKLAQFWKFLFSYYFNQENIYGHKIYEGAVNNFSENIHKSHFWTFSWMPYYFLTRSINNQSLTFETYQDSTWTRLLVNFKRFTSFSNVISLMKCLIYRSFKTCNDLNFFHNDIKNTK